MDQIENFVSSLVANSVVVVVNDEDIFSKLQQCNDAVSFFYVSNDEAKPHERIMKALLGKVPVKRPKFHFQIDLIYYGEGASEEIVELLRQFSHPGGIVANKEICEIYTPNTPAEVEFAKLTQADKQFLWNEIKKVTTKP